MTIIEAISIVILGIFLLAMFFGSLPCKADPSCQAAPPPEPPARAAQSPVVASPLNVTLAAADIARRVPEMARERGGVNNETLIAGILQQHLNRRAAETQS